MDPLTMSLIAGGISVGGGVLGKVFGGSSSGGSSKTANTLSLASLMQEQKQYEETKQMMAPYVQAGATALPLMTSEATAPLGSNPLYQWRLSQGQRSLDQYLSSKGLLGSGAGVQATSNLTNELTGQETDKAFGRQQVLANLGIAGAGGTTQAGQVLASGEANMAGMYMNQGNLQTATQNQLSRDTSSLFSTGGGVASGLLGKYASNQQILDWLSRNNQYSWGGSQQGF